MKTTAQPSSSTITRKTLLRKALLAQSFFVILVAITTNMAIAQGPYANTGNHTVCLNSTEPYGVVLNAGSTYSWTVTPLAGGNGVITAGTTPNLVSINWTTAGTATLQVTEINAQGCPGEPVSIVVTVVPPPTVTVNSSAICAGTSATITATPGTLGTYNYSWTVPAGVTNPGNVASFTSTEAGTYTVVITNTVTNCVSAPASGTVTINSAPTLVINAPSACASSTVDLTAPAVTAGSTAGLTFTYWQDAAATIPYNTPAVATAGTYYIKGSLAAGCFDIKPVVVTINPKPVVAITNPAPACGPVDITAATITAGSTPGVTFTYWIDAAATVPYLTPTTATAGTYYIKGTNASGCFDTKPVVVTTAPAPTPVITGPSPVCETINGSTATYNTPNVAGHTYTWTITGGTITAGQNTNQVTVSWTAPGAGSISVTETIAGGCFSTVSKTIAITAKPITSPITHN